MSDHSIEKRFKNTSASKTFRHIIATFDLGTKAVLDLGCSYGEFLTHFGPGSVGITIAREEVAYGRERGLDIRYGNVEADDFSVGRTFDVVFANNLFEHLYAPHRFLTSVRRYLSPGGILILGVPCVPMLAFLMHVSKFRGSLASSHINFFTRRTLRLTVERAGWDVHMVRGFRLSQGVLDALLNPLYPHFYVVATPRRGFAYSEKRMKEMAGYAGH